jgi:hypothetical protein
MRCTAARRAADSGEVEAALASIEAGRGMYLGVDAGLPGLHPLQATLVAAPSLAIRVFADRLEVQACDAAGEGLRGLGAGRRRADRVAADLSHGVRGDRRQRRTPCSSVPCASTPTSCAPTRSPARRRRVGRRGGDDALGLFFFATSFHRRDAAGAWWHVSLSIDGVPGASRSRPGPLSPGGKGVHVADDFPPGAYADAVARGVERLAAGSLVSLTLSQSFRRRLDPAVSAVAAFSRLRRANPAPVTFCLADGSGTRVFGASPDLQLVVRGRTVESMPVCGTVPRGHGAVGEASALAHLLGQEVDAASLAVCTDAMRNDLAPLCVPGSLALADRLRPMALATVVHTVDRLRGTLRDGVDAWDAVVATTAPPMLVGAPRAAALAAIAELEASPRGWYGGLAVQIAANGDALVGTLLRAAAIDREGIAEVRTGGDLLADSVPAREEDESRVKAVSLWRALGLAVDAGLNARIAGGDASAPSLDGGDPLPAAVALEADADPFAAALADALGSLGLAIDAGAAVCVRAGSVDARCDGATTRRTVAIGDAAVDLLAAAGVATVAILPAHGRAVVAHPCVAGMAGMAGAARPFQVARYATRDVDRSGRATALAGWSPWLVDAEGHPLAVAHAGRRVVCLLFRPESLLCEPPALALLGRAIAFAAADR